MLLQKSVLCSIGFRYKLYCVSLQDHRQDQEWSSDDELYASIIDEISKEGMCMHAHRVQSRHLLNKK